MGECDVMIDDTRGQFSDYLELDNTLSGTIRPGLSTLRRFR